MAPLPPPGYTYDHIIGKINLRIDKFVLMNKQTCPYRR